MKKEYWSCNDRRHAQSARFFLLERSVNIAAAAPPTGIKNVVLVHAGHSLLAPAGKPSRRFLRRMATRCQ